MYESSEALRYDAQSFSVQPEQRPEFIVHDGAGLDSQRREGVGVAFLSQMKLLAAVAVVLTAMFVARVVIANATVVTMSQVNNVKAEISQLQETGSELQVEYSILSRGTRISEIATVQYGMVAPSDTETLELSLDNAA